jgi:hypothetical protein
MNISRNWWLGNGKYNKSILRLNRKHGEYY